MSRSSSGRVGGSDSCRLRLSGSSMSSSSSSGSGLKGILGSLLRPKSASASPPQLRSWLLTQSQGLGEVVELALVELADELRESPRHASNICVLCDQALGL